MVTRAYMKLYFTITCVSVCLSAAACPHYCRDPDVTWKSGRGCPPVVHYWADLESVHGLRCYGNIKRTRNVSEYMLVLALCLVKHCKRPHLENFALKLLKVGKTKDIILNNLHGLFLRAAD